MTPVGSGPRPLSVGLVLPPTTQGELSSRGSSTNGATTAAGDLVELCRRAEATGADSLWAVDHLYWPHPIGEAMTTLAVAATATSRPLLGTCVLQLPLRRPDAVAKEAGALQHLSGGRFVLGLGVGIHEGEYERAGVDFHRRGRIMDEGVARLRAAWDPAGTASDYVQAPASHAIPLWFGGSSVAARRRAAASGDGWVPLFLTPEDYADALTALRRETAEAGRDRDAVVPAVVVFAAVGGADVGERGAAWLSHLYRLPAKAFRRHLVAGSAETCAAGLRRFAEAGAAHIVVMVAGSPAVDQFGDLRAAFTKEEQPDLVGTPA